MTDGDHSEAEHTDRATLLHDTSGSAEELSSFAVEDERHLHHYEQNTASSVTAGSGHTADSSAEDVVEHALETPPFSEHDDADSASAANEAEVPNSADADNGALNQHYQVHLDGSGRSEQVVSSSSVDGADLSEVHTADGAFVLMDAVSTNSGINGWVKRFLIAIYSDIFEMLNIGVYNILFQSIIENKQIAKYKIQKVCFKSI